jgi:putative transposase
VGWAIAERRYTQRRACRLVGLYPKTYRYVSRRPDDSAIRARLRELAAVRRRFGYRRLHIVLRREGLMLNHKKLYRLYREERLMVRKRGGRKRALGTRAPLALPQSPDRGRRLHPRMPGDGGGHLALGPAGHPRARSYRRAPGLSGADRQRQRPM